MLRLLMDQRLQFDKITNLQNYCIYFSKDLIYLKLANSVT